MTKPNEKRSCKRCMCETPIMMTRFNTTNWVEGQTLNHCTEGLCVQSKFFLQPGTTVLVRMKDGEPDSPHISVSEGLPTMALGKIKWFRENSDANPSSYDHGIKYFAPAY